MLEELKVRLVGVSPLLHHNERLSNPFDPWNQKLSDLNKEKRRKGADKLAYALKLSEVEFYGGLYFDDKIGVYAPSKWLKGVLTSGARAFKKGKTVQGVMVTPHRAKLIYSGHDKIQGAEALWDNKGFVDVRMVKVGQARVPRTRPMFDTPWHVDCTLQFVPGTLDKADLVTYLQVGGASQGIGCGRAIGMGKFTVEVR